jgi:hypothetical protein
VSHLNIEKLLMTGDRRWKTEVFTDSLRVSVADKKSLDYSERYFNIGMPE